MSHIRLLSIWGWGKNVKFVSIFAPSPNGNVPKWKQTEAVPKTTIKKTHRSGNSEQCVLLYGNVAVSGR